LRVVRIIVARFSGWDLSLDLVMLGGEVALDQEPIVFGIKTAVS
jgi:hypothetical protein